MRKIHSFKWNFQHLEDSRSTYGSLENHIDFSNFFQKKFLHISNFSFSPQVYGSDKNAWVDGSVVSLLAELLFSQQLSVRVNCPLELVLFHISILEIIPICVLHFVQFVLPCHKNILFNKYCLVLVSAGGPQAHVQCACAVLFTAARQAVSGQLQCLVPQLAPAVLAPCVFVIVILVSNFV